VLAIVLANKPARLGGSLARGVDRFPLGSAKWNDKLDERSARRGAIMALRGLSGSEFSRSYSHSYFNRVSLILGGFGEDPRRGIGVSQSFHHLPAHAPAVRSQRAQNGFKG
jgi:hypothetical protein